MRFKMLLAGAAAFLAATALPAAASAADALTLNPVSVGTVAGASPQTLAAGDFTSDNADDVAVWYYQGARTVTFPSRFGSTPPPTSGATFAAGVNAGGVGGPRAYPADFDKDGKLDLVADNLVALGDGTGRFTNVPFAAPANTFTTLSAVADFNGDGRPDIAHTGTPDSGNEFRRARAISVRLGQSGGVAGPPAAYLWLPLTQSAALLGIAAADINEDGAPDILVSSTDTAAGARLALLINRGDGTFGTPVLRSLPSLLDGRQWRARRIEASDLDHDGHRDLLVGLDTSSGAPTQAAFMVLKGRGDGTFDQLPVQGVISGATYRQLALADINSDHEPDIVVAQNASGNPPLLIGLGHGDGSFDELTTAKTPAGVTVTVTGSETLAVGDFNHDYRPDLASVGTDIAPQALLNTTPDRTPPQTTVEDLPGDTVASATVTVTPRSSEPGSTFLCQIDDGPQTACGSPATFSGLGDGSHSVKISAVDAGGNADGSPSSFSFTVDTRGPQISGGTLGAGQQYAQNSTVTADYDCSDPAGVSVCTGTVPAGQPLDTSTLGEHSFTVTARDRVGNTTSRSVTYTVVDRADPTVTITTPTDGVTYDQGSTLTADYACADEPGGSGLQSCEGTVADGDPVSTSALGQRTFTVTARDQAGNTTSRSVTYTVADRQKPSVTITSPAAGVTYSRGQQIPSAYECADEPGGSGLASCEGTVPDGDLVPASTLGEHEFRVTGRDQAGNERVTTVTYTVSDRDAPAVTLSTPAHGATYARNSTVPADYTCADEPGGSGLASCEGTAADGHPIDTATLGQKTFAVTGRDQAGNQTTRTVTYTVIDATMPTIDLRTPGQNTDYDQGATIPADYDCADEPGGSGLASCQGTVPDGQPINTASGGSHLFTVTAADQAGNTASQTVNYTATDRIAPQVQIVRPAGTYRLGEQVSAQYSCTDNLQGSGLQSCTGTVANGQPINTASLGQKTFTVTGRDNVGNQTTQTVTYNVTLLGCLPILGCSAI